MHHCISHHTVRRCILLVVLVVVAFYSKYWSSLHFTFSIGLTPSIGLFHLSFAYRINYRQYGAMAGPIISYNVAHDGVSDRST